MAVVLAAGALEATWLPEHGMVGSSLRHDGRELLGQRGGLEAYRDRGSAFGIPILAPWANRLAGLTYGQVTLDPDRVKLDGAGLPKDGVLAGRTWTVVEETGTALVATLESDPDVLASFPFPHRWDVRVGLDAATMTVETGLTATGVVGVPVAFGWHPLFTLPGVDRADMDLTVPAVSESPLDARGLPARGAPVPPRFVDGPLADRTADAEYPDIDGDFVLRGPDLAIHVAFGGDTGYPVGHVWAPEGEDFVAWEPMTAPTNALVTGDGLRHVTPGERFAATFSVTVVAG